MAFTYAGRDARDVAIRSPQLPLIAPGTERRVKEAERRDTHIEAATWRGRQVNWHRSRIARLEPILARLGAILDGMDWRGDAWIPVRARYEAVSTAIGAHRMQLDGFAEKADQLIRAKPAKQQEVLSAAYFAALNGDAPTRRPASVRWKPNGGKQP